MICKEFEAFGQDLADRRPESILLRAKCAPQSSAFAPLPETEVAPKHGEAARGGGGR